MKKALIITTIALPLFLTHITAQTVAPLEIGNIWVYDEISNLSRTTVVDTNIYIDSVSYCKLFYEDNYGILEFYNYARLREDGFYVQFSGFDSVYYKKDAVIGDTWSVGTLVYTIEDTFIANVFGEPTIIKFLTVDDGLIYRQEFWTEKFGKLSSQDFGGILDDLQGCVIDGVAYGDTTFTIVSVEDEVSIKGFVLSQNFPNPFNPSTTIRYVIPERSFVTLKVYDVLGKEVTTVINEEKDAGDYSVLYSAVNLPSGIYFYQLISRDFVQTKKMILLK